MALKQTVQLDNGLEVVDGYWKLGNLLGLDKSKGNLQIVRADVSLFKDAEARDAGLPPVITIKIEFNYDVSKETNIFEQAYEFLLTQKRFEGAVNC